ncbi:MAG: TRAM domain-containing protein, partial [bacterium]
MADTTTQSREVTVDITALASGGSCVGTIVAPESAAGKKAFVPYTIPGERVTATIVQDKKSFVNAELVSIQRAAPERQTAPCPVFGRCGGCDLQHIELGAQRRYK